MCRDAFFQNSIVHIFSSILTKPGKLSTFFVFFFCFLQSIPSGFAKRHLNKKLDDIILWLSDGRRWSVRYKFNRRAVCQFGGGWKEFVRDNNLDIGDVCSFELIKGIKISFQVVIFRATEEHCPKLPSEEAALSFLNKLLTNFVCRASYIFFVFPCFPNGRNGE